MLDFPTDALPNVIEGLLVLILPIQIVRESKNFLRILFTVVLCIPNRRAIRLLLKCLLSQNYSSFILAVAGSIGDSIYHTDNGIYNGFLILVQDMSHGRSHVYY